MEKKDFIKLFAAGLFFMIGIALIIFVIFFIGLQRGFTKPKFTADVLFRNVEGMTEGAPVRLSGVNVGIVDSINFMDEEVSGRGLKVTLSIFKKYENQFKKGTKVTIRTEGVLGGKYIEIAIEPRKESFSIDKPIIGEDPLDVGQVAEEIAKTAESFRQSTEGFNKTFNELDDITRKTKRVINRLEQRVLEGNLFKLF